MIVESAERQKIWADIQKSAAQHRDDASAGQWKDFVENEAPHLAAIMAETNDLQDFFANITEDFGNWLHENPDEEGDGDFEIPFDDPTQRTGRYF
jgi:hypothetical protein